MQESMSTNGQRREIGANFRAAAERNLNRGGAGKKEIPLLPSDPRHPDYKTVPKLGPLPKRDPGLIGIRREPGSFKIPEVQQVQPKAKLAESKKSPLLSVEISTQPSVVVGNKPLVPTFQEWQNKQEREEIVKKFDRATAARDAALSPKVAEILTSVREADSDKIKEKAVLKNKIGSALDAMDAEDERDEDQKKQWADKLTGILARSKARKEVKDREKKEAEELTALISSQRTPEQVALAVGEERMRLKKLNEDFENSTPEAIEEANRRKKEVERQALRARLEATADAEIARMDAEEEIERQEEEKKVALATKVAEENFDAHALYRGQNEGMRIPKPSDEDDGIDLPEPVKIIEKEDGYINEVDKDKIRGREKAQFDLSKIQGFDEKKWSDDEKNGKDLAQPIQQAAEIGGPDGDKKAEEFGFGNLGNPDQEWASEIIKRASAPEGSRAIGKGRQVSAEPTRQEKTPKPTMQFSEHKAVASYIEQGNQKDLQKKFEAVQQAEKGYVLAVEALYPKKVKGMTEDQILAINPISITWPFTDNRKTLVDLRKLVDEARSKINGSDTTILDADASKKKTNVRNDDEVISYKDQLINDEVDAFLDQQGVPEGEHDKRKEMELTLKDLGPRLKDAIKAYADAYRSMDSSVANQKDGHFYLLMPPEIGLFSSRSKKDKKRELDRLYKVMSELNALYEEANLNKKLGKKMDPNNF